jgi:hypothetical protein
MPFVFLADEVGEVVAQVTAIGQVEASAALANPGSVRDCRRVSGENGGNCLGRAQVELAVGPTQAVGRLQGRAMFHGHHSVLEAVARAVVVMHVAGGHHRELKLLGQLDQAGDTARVAPDQVVLQLDEGAVPAEQAGQTASGLERVVETARVDQARDFAGAAAG